MASEMQNLLKEAGEMGFTVTTTGKCGDHYRFTRPGCRVVFGSSTPGDRRAVLNIRAKLRRAVREAEDDGTAATP